MARRDGIHLGPSGSGGAARSPHCRSAAPSRSTPGPLPAATSHACSTLGRRAALCRAGPVLVFQAKCAHTHTYTHTACSFTATRAKLSLSGFSAARGLACLCCILTQIVAAGRAVQGCLMGKVYAWVSARQRHSQTPNFPSLWWSWGSFGSTLV